MNDDLLIYKRRAMAMTTLQQPPLWRNGKKKSYIKIMKELLDAKGYGELGFSNINFCDHAARLEKSTVVNSQNTSVENTSREERAELNSELLSATLDTTWD